MSAPRPPARSRPGLLSGLAALVACAALSLAGCGEDSTGLVDLDGLWQFTFVERDTGRSDEALWRLAIDGDRVIVTPVVDGSSRIDQRRSGSASGDADRFTLTIDEEQGGCAWQRVLRGRHLETRLSGTYELRPGAECPGDDEHALVYGSFGAVLSEG